MTPLETVTIGDASSDSSATFAPERGGILTRLTLRGRSLLYLDEATLVDPTKNVRGGNPVLFPSPGKLAGDRWPHGPMGQHGFARTMPWAIIAVTTGAAALSLTSNDATRAVYPWDFTAQYTYTLQDGALAIGMHIENRGSSPMPFGAGFHPYFSVPQAIKGDAHFKTDATQVFDNVTKETRAIGVVDFTAAEVDLHLLDHGSSDATLDLPGGAIHIRCSPQFKRWVLWTVRGKDFVCVEPWTAPGNALNTGDDVLTIAPGAALDLTVAYSV